MSVGLDRLKERAQRSRSPKVKTRATPASLQARPWHDSAPRSGSQEWDVAALTEQAIHRGAGALPVWIETVSEWGRLEVQWREALRLAWQNRRRGSTSEA
jgi:hypothetical protein